ncbi:tRNA lysidine(34) synthetase TilS [Helicobacter magdeburgensis]|uniref:tRNA(Ile)-lysidine synthase n=1 Tax=Helicobacter magdeburgensis TaxID=471858 RepID=A0A4U8T1K8_9HELI|nr:tRNA lysidine(34) synthetase TilS [Helicobacter magdeburgensis]TLD93174.1 tRNA lysidine(34) synthetase TilS [Helicobacter magdeburgensis]
MPPFLSPLSLRLREKILPLADSKNLLGFSGGVDSTALFFLLVEYEIPFDMAIVHYHTRKQADDELSHAQHLAKLYNKHCFISHAPQFSQNFESQARAFRFSFFDEIMQSYGYGALILAHQLNDRFEWLLMQLTRGAGLENLLGFESTRKGYAIARPLESISKDEIYAYCKEKGLKYFEDSSNMDLGFKRNAFRARFANELTREYGRGIAKSLEYLKQDKQRLNTPSVKRLRLECLARLTQDSKDCICSQGGVIFKLESTLWRKKECEGECENVGEKMWGNDVENGGENDTTSKEIEQNRLLQGCDKIAKLCGYVLSFAQRKEIVKSGFCCKIHYLMVTHSESALFVAVDIFDMYQNVTIPPMTRDFKTFCQKSKIPPRLRKLLFAELCLLESHQKADDEKNLNLSKNKEKQADFKQFMKKISHFFAI